MAFPYRHSCLPVFAWQRVVLHIFDPKQLLRVSCILWCYYLKCYPIIFENASLRRFNIITSSFYFTLVFTILAYKSNLLKCFFFFIFFIIAIIQEVSNMNFQLKKIILKNNFKCNHFHTLVSYNFRKNVLENNLKVSYNLIFLLNFKIRFKIS